nr:pentatricopeptide repeat-containing protein At1g63330-like [Ipomoea trifida]
MCATVRRVHCAFKACHKSSLLSISNASPLYILSLLYKSRVSHFASFSSDSSVHCSTSHFSDRNFDFIEQFSPFKNLSNTENYTVITSNERRRILVGLSKIIKQENAYLLNAFSSQFCPYYLAEIMKSFDNRGVAVSFFKYVFQDYSQGMVQSGCIAAHLLAAMEMRLMAQDVLSWIIRRIGKCRSDEVVEFMWREHFLYESDYSVLDSLMRAFLSAEMIPGALKILSMMREAGAQPSLSAVSILFKLLLRFRDYGSVWKLFRDMLHKGPCPNLYVYNVMILGFCKSGCLQIGESLLHLMRKFGCEPDAITYNILINAYCMKGWTSDALNWVHLMIEHGCNPSSITFGTIVSALCKEGNIIEARKIFDGMQEIGVSANTEIYNALMDGYVKAREIDQANALFEEMIKKGVVPDGITVNTLVAGYYKYRREEHADRLLKDLTMMELIPDCSLTDVYIAGLCWAERLDEAVELLHTMLEKGIPLSVIAFNSIIAAYSRVGLEDNAFEIYNIMVKFGQTPSASTCASLLMCLCTTGRLHEAKELMTKMIAMDFPISRISFTVLLDGYFKKGDTTGAQILWEEMARIVSKLFASGWEPDITTYNIRLHGFCTSRKINRAVMMLDELISAGLVPNTVTYNTMMSGACNDILDRAMILAAKLVKMAFIPNIVTANLLLSQLCKQGLPQRALMWGQKLSQIGIEFDEITYKILDRAFFEIQDYTDCTKGMTEKSLFLDILMYITCDYLYRNRANYDRSDYNFEIVDGPGGSLKLVNRVDDFDAFMERMLGSIEKKPLPFAENSGAGIALGLLPLASSWELLSLVWN